MNIKRFLAIMLFGILMIPSIMKAGATEQKIAVVDIPKVVAASPQVKALQASQEAKKKEITTFIKNAQADIKKQKDDKAKQIAAEKYEKQLLAKREANVKEYKEKLKAADKSIYDQIIKKATEMGYTLVLPKISVLYGGDDITIEIIKVIK